MSGSKFRIMTHNIWIPPLHNRRQLLGDIYNRYDPDILCLQEITPVIHNEGFLQDFEGKFAVVLPKNGEYYNNTPVLYKPDRFTLVDSGWHLFDGKNNSDTKSVTWSVLERIEDGQRIGICSAHFWYAELSAEDDLCRKYDAEQCLPYIKRMVDQYQIPVIIAGDLNCKIGSSAYNCLIENGGMDTRIAAESYKNRINTFHGAPELNEETCLYSDGPLPIGSHLEAIDHMILFAHEKLKVHTLSVVTEQTALDASDHCPVYIDAEFIGSVK